MLQPVMAYALDTPFSTMVRSFRSGQALTMLQNGSADQRMCSYMSSVAISSCGWRRNTAPRPSSSAREYTPPVGLDGLLITTSLVLGVSARSSCSGAILNACWTPDAPTPG